MANVRIPEASDFMEEYEILEIICEGSYGVVYKGRDKTSNEIVAAKKEIDGMCRATKSEIEILSVLTPHPCIVGFKKVMIEKGGAVFVVMEYMEYDLFSYRESREEPFQLKEIKFFMGEILHGIKFFHDQGVMHRDLKPHNILFTPRNGRNSRSAISIYMV